MAKFEDFYHLVAPFAPGVSEPAMDNMLREAAIEFCQETLVWTEDVDRMPVLLNVAEYEIDLPVGAQVARLLEVTVNGHPVDPVPFDSLSSLVPGWRTATGTPSKYVQSAPDTFRLVPIPSARTDGALAYRCAFLPTRKAATLPDILLHRYAQAIADGALTRLLQQPDTTYYDPAAAAVRFTAFESAKDGAAIDQFKGYGRAPIRSKPAFF